MNLFSFDAINRRTYIFGVIALGFISMSINYSGMKSLSNNNLGKMLPVLCLILLIKIIWDYKRIKDITPSKYSLFFLIIPVVTGIFSLFIEVSTTNMFSLISMANLDHQLLLSAIVTFSTINLIYKIILFFKKSYIMDTATGTM